MKKGKETKKGIKKILIGLLFVFLIPICLVGCENNSTPNAKEVNYKEVNYTEYTLKNITLNLPIEWNLEVNETDQSISSTINDFSGFSVLITKNVPPAQFEYFGTTFVPDLLKNMNYTLLNSYIESKYSNYEAYDYIAETMIQGKKAQVLVTTLNVNNDAVTMMLVFADDDNNYDYKNIYSHILNTIK